MKKNVQTFFYTLFACVCTYARSECALGVSVCAPVCEDISCMYPVYEVSMLREQPCAGFMSDYFCFTSVNMWGGFHASKGPVCIRGFVYAFSSYVTFTSTGQTCVCVYVPAEGLLPGLPEVKFLCINQPLKCQSTWGGGFYNVFTFLNTFLETPLVFIVSVPHMTSYIASHILILIQQNHLRVQSISKNKYKTMLAIEDVNV